MEPVCLSLEYCDLVTIFGQKNEAEESMMAVEVNIVLASSHNIRIVT